MADPRRRRRIRGQRRGMGRRKPKAHWAKEARTSKTKLHSRTAGSLSGTASWQAGRPCRNLPPRCTNEGWALGKGDPANNLQGFAPQVLRA